MAEDKHKSDKIEWISVEKALPETNIYVFVCNSDDEVPQCLSIAYYTGTEWIDAEDNKIRPDYWMPIPEIKN